MLFILFFVYMIFDSEKQFDKKRAEYIASEQEYQEALQAYKADSVYMKAQYQRIQTEIDAAVMVGLKARRRRS